MPNFAKTERPTHSPWGHVQTAEQVAPGLWFVTTPSHGGFILSEEREAAIPRHLKADGYGYEEDCGWCKVVVAFRKELGAIHKPHWPDGKTYLHWAIETLQVWYPEAYAIEKAKLS